MSLTPLFRIFNQKNVTNLQVLPQATRALSRLCGASIRNTNIPLYLPSLIRKIHEPTLPQSAEYILPGLIKEQPEDVVLPPGIGGGEPLLASCRCKLMRCKKKARRRKKKAKKYKKKYKRCKKKRKKCKKKLKKCKRKLKCGK